MSAQWGPRGLPCSRPALPTCLWLGTSFRLLANGAQIRTAAAANIYSAPTVCWAPSVRSIITPTLEMRTLRHTKLQPSPSLTFYLAFSPAFSPRCPPLPLIRYVQTSHSHFFPKHALPIPLPPPLPYPCLFSSSLPDGLISLFPIGQLLFFQFSMTGT